MAKETDDKDDDKLVDNGQLGDDDEGQEPQDTSIRGALKAAIKETEEKGDDDDNTSDDDDNRRRDKTDEETDKKDSKSTKKPSEAGGERREEQRPDKAAKPETKQEDKTEPPPYYKTKGKAVWDKLAPEDRQLIIAREQEVSQGFAQISPKVRAFDELEKVISPRLPAIQQFGTTPAATIDRLFQWMEALSHPDGKTRVGSFKQLASNFGIDLAQLGSSETRHDGTDPTQTVDDQNPPAWAQGIVGEVTNLKQQLTTQQQAAADAAVTNWANAKSTDGTPLRPHYSKVNELMYKLMVSETVPMKNGALDLDGAYELACKIHPEVAALIQQEAAEKAEKERLDKEAQDAKMAKARLEKAKRAGAGLKPAAPSIPSNQVKGKPNGTGNRSESVRDSLRKSLEELRE